MTTPPVPLDLSTKAGRKALRHEMRMVAVRPRRWGLWLLAIGTLLLIMPTAFGLHSLFGWSPVWPGLLACMTALPLLVTGAVLRRRYRRGRLTPGVIPGGNETTLRRG